jgi:hypothetical protein
MIEPHAIPALRSTSPIGRGVGRLWRPFLRTPKQSFGYVASQDAIRVRGVLYRWVAAPHPGPLPNGERGPIFVWRD